MKKFLKMIIVGGLISSLCMPLWAKSQVGNPIVKREFSHDDDNKYRCEFPDGETLILSENEIHTFFMVNGTIIPKVNLKIVNGHSLVPIRIISEELGMNVQWQKSNHSVTIKKEGISVEVITEKTKAKINDKEINLETPATIFNGTVYVPSKFIAQAFSLSIEYISPTSSRVDPISEVLKNPLITLDEKPAKDRLSKQQAVIIAKNRLNALYDEFLKEYTIFKEQANYDEGIKDMKKDIEEMCVKDKISRYWVIYGPKVILVDEYTGNMFFFHGVGRNEYIKSVNEDNSCFLIFAPGYLAQ